MTKLEEQAGWRPIKEAPKDGTEVDLFCTKEEFPTRYEACVFREPTDMEYWANGSEEPSRNEGTFSHEAAWFSHAGFKVYDPTHFKLLDSPDNDREAKLLEQIRVLKEALEDVTLSSGGSFAGINNSETALRALQKYKEIGGEDE